MNNLDAQNTEVLLDMQQEISTIISERETNEMPVEEMDEKLNKVWEDKIKVLEWFKDTLYDTQTESQDFDCKWLIERKGSLQYIRRLYFDVLDFKTLESEIKENHIARTSMTSLLTRSLESVRFEDPRQEVRDSMEAFYSAIEVINSEYESLNKLRIMSHKGFLRSKINNELYRAKRALPEQYDLPC